MNLSKLENDYNSIWQSCSMQEKKIYMSIAANLFKPPAKYNAANPLHKNDVLKKEDDWSKAKNAQSPIERKAYLTGTKSKIDFKTNAAKINSRQDYHKASKAFHEGRSAHILASKPAKDSPYSKQLQFHQQAANLHHNAATTQDSNNPFHAAYPKHLANIQKHYSAMETHAKQNKLPTGTGHTRFITKE
jgi:hypothetical protein